MQPWIVLAVLAAVSDTTGALHQKTLERLERKPALGGRTVPIARFHVAVDWRPFGSVEEAAGAEAAIDWFDATRQGVARQAACTLSFAALELRQYLARMGQRQPAPIRVPGGEGDGLAITTLGRLTSEQLARMPAGIVEMLRGGPERFAVVPFEDGSRMTVMLVGSDRIGALYAVYDFLERQGVRFIGLGESEEVVPQRTGLLIPTAYSGKPGFGLRSLYGYRKNRGTEPFFSWMAKNKLNAWGADDLLPGMRKRGFKLYGGNHWVQPEAGIRGNVCLSDEPQTETFVRNVVNLLADGIYKDLDILEYLPADWGVRCEEDNKFGSPTDRDVLLVHRLRKAIRAAYEAGRLRRDVQVFFYAYFDTVSPPTRPLPPDFDYQRTSVGFYAMRCFNHAINDPSCNEAFVAYIKRAGGEFAVSRPVNAQLNAYLGLWTGGKTPWKGRVGYGDYYSMARLFQIPNPLMNIIAADIPYAHKLGVWDARYMHPTTSDWGTKTLTNYQFAKMLWDPNLDVPALLAEYFRLRYGAAAQPMCDFYFRLERAMANIMWLKGDFVDRFNRIYKMKDTLFIWDHLHLEPYQPAINDGVDLEESLTEMQRCRELLDRALASARNEAAQRRIREDDAWFQYSSNTIHFYYHMAKTYTRWVAGDRPGAVRSFAEAEKHATLLRTQTLPILVQGVHQPNQADGLEAARLMPAYEHFKKEFGGTQ